MNMLSKVSQSPLRARPLSQLRPWMTGSLAIAPLLGLLSSPTPTVQTVQASALNLAPTIHHTNRTNRPNTQRFAPTVACRRNLPLQPVGGTDPEVVKRVSIPSLLVSRNNWNTDFTVPTEINFTSFRVNLFFKDSGTYNVKAFLKYGDNSNDEFYNDKVRVEPNKLMQLQAFPRRRSSQRALQPFQVNTLVGNMGSVGNVYVVSVDGCR